MTTFRDAVRQTEEHLLNAWPALRTMLCDGWVFRQANGYTKRANSASAFESRGAFLPTLREAERFYASLDYPAIFRLTPLAGREPDRILADRGYRMIDETIVMTAPLVNGAFADPAISLAPHCEGGWEAGYTQAQALAEGERRAHRAILEKIAPLKTAFATAHQDGRAVAFGLGVLERDRLGLFDIVTVPEARRRGMARRLVGGIMDWGAQHGAARAWLSVIGENEKAKLLYTQLGFTELYRYHYRIADPAPAARGVPASPATCSLDR